MPSCLYKAMQACPVAHSMGLLRPKRSAAEQLKPPEFGNLYQAFVWREKPLMDRFLDIQASRLDSVLQPPTKKKFKFGHEG